MTNSDKAADTALTQSPFTNEVKLLMRTCIDHARDLLDAAQVVKNSGKPNIAYHLATLALEEIGRRELIALQTVANATTVVAPTWPLRHTQDHEQKLFWAFFGALFRGQKITTERVEEMRSFAKHIQARRIAGLYIDWNAGPNVPREAIPAEESKDLIGLVEARLSMASAEERGSEASKEDIDLQNWFLKASDDEEKRHFIFSDGSMTKLAELKDAREWIAWLKVELDAAQAHAMEILKRELAKRPHDETVGAKLKWKMRIRLFADANSVRPKAVNWWNEHVNWIKLTAVPKHHNEVIVDILLNDDVPLDRLWFAGWFTARMFIAAINLATRGLWWWHLPRQISRYYERVDDLNSGLDVKLDRSPRLKIDWGTKPVLDEEALRQTMIRLIVLINFPDSEAKGAIDYYLGGLTFLALNEIHWQCEPQSYGNFHHGLKLLMKTYGGWDGKEPFEAAFGVLLKNTAPAMPAEQHERFLSIARAYESDTPENVGVNLTDVALIKVMCDNYFAGSVAPAILSKLQAQEKRQG